MNFKTDRWNEKRSTVKSTFIVIVMDEKIIIKRNYDNRKVSEEKQIWTGEV